MTTMCIQNIMHEMRYLSPIVKLEKLLNVQLYSDGLSLTPESGKPKLVQVPRRVGLEIAAAILAKVMESLGQ